MIARIHIVLQILFMGVVIININRSFSFFQIRVRMSSAMSVECVSRTPLGRVSACVGTPQCVKVTTRSYVARTGSITPVTASCIGWHVSLTPTSVLMSPIRHARMLCWKVSEIHPFVPEGSRFYREHYCTCDTLALPC